MDKRVEILYFGLALEVFFAIWLGLEVISNSEPTYLVFVCGVVLMMLGVSTAIYGVESLEVTKIIDNANQRLKKVKEDLEHIEQRIRNLNKS